MARLLRILPYFVSSLALFALAGCHQRGSDEGEPVLIAGGSKYILTPKNARAVCNFTGEDRRYTIACRAAVLTDGRQHFADAIEDGVKIAWARPQGLLGVALADVACPADNRALQWSCDVTLPSAAPTQVQVDLDVLKGRQKVTEFARVALISIFSFGNAPQVPFDYVVPSTERRTTGTSEPVSYRSQSFDPTTTHFGSGHSACSLDGTLYVSSADTVYAIRENRAVLFAGSPNPANGRELSHPSRTYLAGPVSLYCHKDPKGTGSAVYLTSYTGARLLRATADTIELIAERAPGANDEILVGPRQSVVAPDGTVYVADTRYQVVHKFTPNGTHSVVAGTFGTAGFSGDGYSAATSHLNDPSGVALLADGSLVIADSGNHRLRRIARDGTISTIAGTGMGGSTGDGGPALRAGLRSPGALAVVGDTLYVVDYPSEAGSDGHIRAIRDGVISRPSWSRFFIGVFNLAAGDGALQVVRNESGSARSVHQVDLATGTVRVVAGQASTTRFAVTDGADLTKASMNTPKALAFLPDGSLVATFPDDHRVRRIDVNGVMTTLAGGEAQGFSGDGGPAASALLDSPDALAAAADGSVYVGDARNGRLRRIGPDGIITSLAYPGSSGLAQSPTARLATLAATADGSLYVADYFAGKIHRIRPDGTSVRIAGNGFPGAGPDGFAAVNSSIGNPCALDVEENGDVYFADCFQPMIRKIGADGLLRTVAGTGVASSSALAVEGSDARTVLLHTPVGIAIDGTGAVYFTDKIQSRVYRAEPASGGGYTLHTFLGGSSNRDCAAGGIIRSTSDAAGSGDALQASLSVMCLGRFTAIAALSVPGDGRLAQETIAVGQTLSPTLDAVGAGNILKTQRTWGRP